MADELKHTPRRPLYDDEPDGYQESDNDYVLNNVELAVSLLEQHDAIVAQSDIISALCRENTLLRHAARAVYYRHELTSGSLAMHECDEMCAKVGLEVWKWPLHLKEES